MTQVREITQEEFKDKVLSAKQPVLVDFYADWSGSSITQDSVLENFARSFDKKVVIMKVNIDRFPELANSYWIRTIPTLLLFRNGAHSETKIDIEEETESALSEIHEFTHIDDCLIH